MQAISLRPQQRVIVNKQIALFVLVALIAVAPALNLPLAMLTLLFICPLAKSKKAWVAMLAVPLPAVIALLHGYPLAYAFFLLLLLAVPAFATYRQKMEETYAFESFLPYTLFIAVVSSCCIWALYLDAWREGANLAEFLAEKVTTLVMTHPQRTQLLYQAMSTGLLPVPEGYKQVTLLQLTLDPVFLNELRLMLRTRVVQLVETQLPSLVGQSSILLGVFINLRVQRMWGAYLLLDRQEPQKVSIALAPSYSNWSVPGRWHGVMVIFILLYMACLGSRGFMLRLAQLGYCFFEAVYQLQGGAVVCTWIMRKNPERRVLAGVLTAALYLFVPFALFFIGCFDNLFSFRSKAKDDKNDREKNKEEEP